MNDLVIIHDSVERLNPHRINVTIQHDPFRTVTSLLTEVSHQRREETWTWVQVVEVALRLILVTIFPLSGGRVDVAKQLKGGDGLGVEIHPQRLAAHDGISLVE